MRRNAGADFSSASSDVKALDAFFCNFATLQLRNFVILAACRESRTVSRAPVYQIL